MISRWECGGGGGWDKRDSCIEREMGEIKEEMGGEREDEPKPGERPATEREDWRYDEGSGGAEADGGEDDEVLACGRSGQALGEDGVRLKRPPLLHRFHRKVEFSFFFTLPFGRRLIIKKQPPIRSG